MIGDKLKINRCESCSKFKKWQDLAMVHYRDDENQVISVFWNCKACLGEKEFKNLRMIQLKIDVDDTHLKKRLKF